MNKRIRNKLMKKLESGETLEPRLLSKLIIVESETREQTIAERIAVRRYDLLNGVDINNILLDQAEIYNENGIRRLKFTEQCVLANDNKDPTSRFMDYAKALMHEQYRRS